MIKYIWGVFAVLVVLLVASGIGLSLLLTHTDTVDGIVERPVDPSTGFAWADDDDSRIVPPPSGDAIDDLLSSVRVDDGISYRGLTIFPVHLRRDYSDFLPRSFDDAVDSGDLIVKEVGRGEVGRVRVMNEGKRPVFIMAGEIMTGSKQDRTARGDLLIPARSDWVEIPVYCVEEGRWTQVSPTFKTRRSLAAPSLRQQAYAEGAQEDIWAEVERSAGENAVSQDRSKAFQQIYESEGVKERIRDYRTNLRLPKGRRTVGFVAFRGRDPVGADLFGNEALFDDLHEKLLNSYILTAGPDYRRWGEPASTRDAALFLAQAWAEVCRRIPASSPGIGQGLRLHNGSAGTDGAALLYRNDAVHVSLFPARPSRPGPIPVPIPVPRPMIPEGVE